MRLGVVECIRKTHLFGSCCKHWSSFLQEPFFFLCFRHQNERVNLIFCVFLSGKEGESCTFRIVALRTYRTGRRGNPAASRAASGTTLGRARSRSKETNMEKSATPFALRSGFNPHARNISGADENGDWTMFGGLNNDEHYNF